MQKYVSNDKNHYDYNFEQKLFISLTIIHNDENVIKI